MGSPLRLTIHSGVELSIDAAAHAWLAVRDEFERAEQAMSRFRESSDLTLLNRNAGRSSLLPIDGRLRRALVAARRAQAITGGRFDARVLRDLDRLGYRGAEVGSSSATAPKDDADGGDRDWLRIDRRRSEAALAEPIDLGGIGKGLALRWAWRRLIRIVDSSTGRRRPGVHAEGDVRRGAVRTVHPPAPLSALLEAGGDIVGCGLAPDGGPWLVGIEDPFALGRNVAVVALRDAAIATSSIAVNRWRDASGAVVHHLIDPRTGQPGGAGLVAATVVTVDPAWAEVWSKSLFLAGADRIASVARGRGLAAWWITDEGGLEMTPAARLLTVWSA